MGTDELQVYRLFTLVTAGQAGSCGPLLLPSIMREHHTTRIPTPRETKVKNSKYSFY